MFIEVNSYVYGFIGRDQSRPEGEQDIESTTLLGKESIKKESIIRYGVAKKGEINSFITLDNGDNVNVSETYEEIKALMGMVEN